MNKTKIGNPKPETTLPRQERKTRRARAKADRPTVSRLITHVILRACNPFLLRD